MKFIQDEKKYDELQLELLEEIRDGISRQLHEAGLYGDKLKEATDNATFSVATIQDSSQIMKFDGKPLRPYLAFEDPNDSSQIVHSGHPSWMHEYVFQ